MGTTIRRTAMVAAAAALGLAACSSGGSGASGHSALLIADVAPFSGVDAALGPTYLISCDGATQAINSAGGVLGHKLSCTGVDTRGDPADAVPAVNRMFATSSPALVIGCTSDEAASVVPIINNHKTVMFCMTGQSEFDHTHQFPYFYRLVPPDLEESYAMVAIAQQLHYKRIALAFGNDIGSQTFVGPAVGAIAKAGMTLAANETLDLSATTFRTEAAKIVAAHPDVIMTEALGPADATFLSEIKQLNNGRMIPVIGTSATISPAWYKAVAGAIGASTLASSYHADNLVVETGGPSFGPFRNALFAEKGKVTGANNGAFATYLTAPGAVHLYDGINLTALAMIAANSTSPAKFVPYIKSIGDGTPGATVVYSFAQGAAALKAGKKIRYEGPGGPTSFDSYHDSTGIFQVDTYGASGAVQVAGNLTPAQLRALS